ncbi:MAG: response regulator [Clostridiales bacterium]|nr:response regulator [Clostridiales bacterium]
MKVKITRRLVFIFSLCAAVLVAATITVLGVIYLVSMQSSLWRQLVQDVSEVANQGAHSFETYVYKEGVSVEMLANNLSKLSSDDTDEINDILELYTSDGLYTLAIFEDDGSGTLYIANNEQAMSLTAEEAESRYGTYGESGISEPYLNDYNGHSTIGYYQRLVFKDGKTGIVRKGQLLSYLREEFSLTYYNDTGYSYIVKVDGDIMIRPTHKNSNRTFSNVFDIVSHSANDKATVQTLIDNMNEGNRGAMRMNFNGDDCVVAFTPLEITELWYLISVIPDDILSQHSNSILNTSQSIVVVVLAVLLVSIIVIMLVYIYNRKMKKKEAEVLYREQLFNMLVNNTDDVYLMMDATDFSVEYVSPNVDRVLGVTVDEVKKDISALGVAEYDDGTKFDFDALHAIGENDQREHDCERVHKVTGEHRFFKETLYHASLENEEKYIAVMSDRTSEKAVENALKDAMDTANSANKAKSVFLSNMSHDIRTPMNAIMGFIELIRRDASNAEKVLTYAQKMSASGHHLMQLINDVLDMSKIENGKIALNISEIKLASFVDELCMMIRPQSKAKNQEFEVDVRDVREENLLGDALRLNQILINILSNAVKYTPEGGKVELLIRELPRINDNFARLEFVIKDNGIGMSDEFLKTVFDPFSREVSSTVNKIQGTGLGLAITKNLIDLMGGVITVESEPNKGSTFRVELEFRIDEEDVELEFWRENEISRVLVVDDDEYTCRNVTDILQGEKLDTAYALDGASAIKTVKAEHKKNADFDLILLDMKMPGMDGIETAKRIRSIVSKDVSILMLTAYDWSELEDVAKDVGIDAFLPKPFFLSNLKLNVRNLKQNKNAADGAGEAEFSLAGKRFLAAEDNELNSEILVELLDMIGAKCELAENGEQAVEMFERSEEGYYDAILMDIQMPVMNGYDATTRIRKGTHPRAATVPIVAMTANAFSEDVNRSLASGMNAHVAKPIDVGHLETVLHNLLKKNS